MLWENFCIQGLAELMSDFPTFKTLPFAFVFWLLPSRGFTNLDLSARGRIGLEDKAPDMGLADCVSMTARCGPLEVLLYIHTDCPLCNKGNAGQISHSILL